MSSSTRQRQDCAEGCYAAFGRESGSSTSNDIYLRATSERTVEAWGARAGLPDRLETSFVARAVGRRGTNGCQTIGGGQNG